MEKHIFLEPRFTTSSKSEEHETKEVQLMAHDPALTQEKLHELVHLMGHPSKLAQDMIRCALDFMKKGDLETAQGVAKNAILIDRFSIVGYCFFAMMEENLSLRMLYAKKAIDLGNAKIKELEPHLKSDEYDKDAECIFYLRALESYGNDCYILVEIQSALIHLEKVLYYDKKNILKAHYRLLLLHILVGRMSKYSKLRKQYPLEENALDLFIESFYLLLAKGDTEESRDMLLRACNANPWILEFLIGDTKPADIEDPIFSNPMEEEAYHTADVLLITYESYDDIIDWVTEQSEKIDLSQLKKAFIFD